MAEAAALRRFYRRLRGRKARSERPSLLELGAGGGHILSHLRESFDCTATDLSSAMLENCARLVPGIATVQGDMRDLRLERCFDAVLIADAVDYMATASDVRAALATAAAHLSPGGAVFVGPTYIRENFVDGDVASETAPSHGLSYLSYVHDRDPSDSEYELILVYLIRDRTDRTVEVIEDRHVCGLFSASEWLSMLSDAGFDASPLENARAWTLFGGRLRARAPETETE